MSLAEQLKDFRKRHQLTMRECAEMFGVSFAEIQRIESEKNKPNISTIGKWEKRLTAAEEMM
jgi:transcriptional regulator with XRE-family HTH domain